MGGYERCNSDGDNYLNSGRKVAARAELPRRTREAARVIISAGRGYENLNIFVQERRPRVRCASANKTGNRGVKGEAGRNTNERESVIEGNGKARWTRGAVKR